MVMRSQERMEEGKILNEGDAKVIEGSEDMFTHMGGVEGSLMTPSHFVLVHGFGAGSWSWYKIIGLLKNSGHKVTCFDLKAAGIDPTDPNTITSFEDYNRPLLDFLSSLPDNEQVILVGSSSGGLNVTHASHAFPSKICLAIYVAATMLKTGFSNDEDAKIGAPVLDEYGEAYDMEFGLGPNQPPTAMILKEELVHKLVVNLCPLEDLTLTMILRRPGPIQAVKTAKFLEGNGDIEKVPRIYIKTTKDMYLKPEQQDAMIKKWPPSRVYEIEADHCPNLSSPAVLSNLLVEAAASVGCD